MGQRAGVSSLVGALPDVTRGIPVELIQCLTGLRFRSAPWTIIAWCYLSLSPSS